MKLSTYIESLQRIAEKHPDLDVVYARDDEGNGFQEVSFTPSTGRFEDGDFCEDQEEFNAVCIN